MAQPAKRAKVQLQFTEKLFYEKVLVEWRDSVILAGATKHAFVLRNALVNLKLFPLDVNGFSELRKIRGIGVDIATQLDAAWKYARDVHFANQMPNIAHIKALKKGEALAILEQSSREKGGRLPFGGIKRSTQTTAENKQKNEPLAKQKCNNQPIKNVNMGSSIQRSCSQEYIAYENIEDNNDHLLDYSVSQPALSFEFEDLPHAAPANFIKNFCSNSESITVRPSTSTGNQTTAITHTQQLLPSTSDNNSSSSLTNPKSIPYLSGYLEKFAERSPSLISQTAPTSIPFLTRSASQFAQSRLLLITDNREHIAGSRSRHRKVKGVGEHLLSMNVNFESRPLSVGDYIWILQWTDLAGKKQELVMDYVVERKTFDDLKRSIRETRYIEQKQRLCRCGLSNVVLLVEGTANADRSLEQAMVSTSVESGFLVHRTHNLQGTAKFLQHLTKKLEQRCSKEQVAGPPFDVFQEECKKEHAISVSDCWLRQLTVCPRMSIDRAQLIRQRFPSFRSLVEFYRDRAIGNDEDQTIISREIDQLPVSISSQLHTFLRQTLDEK